MNMATFILGAITGLLALVVIRHAYEYCCNEGKVHKRAEDNTGKDDGMHVYLVLGHEMIHEYRSSIIPCVGHRITGADNFVYKVVEISYGIDKYSIDGFLRPFTIFVHVEELV